MNNLLKGKVFLLLFFCLCSIKISTQEGSFHFFHQQPEYPRDCKEARDQCSSNNFDGVYIIKPYGYPKPFEVYCNNKMPSGGWTVIQRRIDGSLTFKRNWEDYKIGFGFLSSEFYVGNDKLSYLTNQALYELRIDLMLSNGSSFYVKYNPFRISDEWSQFAVVIANEFSGNSSCVVSTCPTDMTYGGCTCQRLCSDHFGMTVCNDNCMETCLLEECANGDWYINDDCTENCTCINNQVNCDTNYQCSPDATCAVKNGVRKCYCNDDYQGDGETCTRIVTTDFTDCYDAYQAGHTTDGIYTILPTGWLGSSFAVFCNMTFGNGGWTVFQRRTDGVTDFYRNWEDYKHGFGTLSQGNDFWLGNEQLHYLTYQKDYLLRVDFVDSNDLPFYEEYTVFKIGDESTKYQLSYVSFNDANTGTDSNENGLAYSNGAKFSTRDQDNDDCNFHDCAERHRGAWWYKPDIFNGCVECFHYYYFYCYYFQTRSDCYNICTAGNVNGDYNGGDSENIFYGNNNGGFCNHKFTEMKIRPSSP